MRFASPTPPRRGRKPDVSQLLRDEGVILRATPFQDRHLILSAFTAEDGKLPLFVKSARGARSRFGPEIDLLCLSEFVFLHSNHIRPLREATLVEHFPALKADYDRLTSAMGSARLRGLLSEEGQADPSAYRLFLALLHALNEDALAPVTLYELAFKLRLLDNFGVAPRLEGCVRCGRKGEVGGFSLEQGGVLCRRCRGAGDLALGAGLAHSLNAMRTMSWETLGRLRLSAGDAAGGAQLLEQFTSYHVRATAARGRGTQPRK